MKLIVDLNAFIKDEKVFAEIQRRERMKKKFQKTKVEGESTDEDEDIANPSYAAIIQYIEGSYFGDADIFAIQMGLDNRGRDASATSVGDCSIFMMDKKTLMSIKENHNFEYIQLAKLGIKRHKKHQIIVSKFVHHYLEWAKVVRDENRSSSEDGYANSNSFSKEDDPEASSSSGDSE